MTVSAINRQNDLQIAMRKSEWRINIQLDGIFNFWTES